MKHVNNPNEYMMFFKKFFLQSFYSLFFFTISLANESVETVIDEAFVNQLDFNKDIDTETPFYIKESISIATSDTLWKVSYIKLFTIDTDKGQLHVFGVNHHNDHLKLSSKMVNAVFTNNSKITANFTLYWKSNFADGMMTSFTSIINNDYLFIFDGNTLENVINFNSPTVNLRSDFAKEKNINYSRIDTVVFNLELFNYRLTPFIKGEITEMDSLYYITTLVKGRLYVTMNIEDNNCRTFNLVIMNNRVVEQSIEIGKIIKNEKGLVNYLKIPLITNGRVIRTHDNYGKVEEVYQFD